MAKIKIDLIVEHLGVQLQGAMKDMIRDTKLAGVNERDLLRAFQKAVKMRCGTWETVPDSAVDTGY